MEILEQAKIIAEAVTKVILQAEPESSGLSFEETRKMHPFVMIDADTQADPTLAKFYEHVQEACTTLLSYLQTHYPKCYRKTFPAATPKEAAEEYYLGLNWLPLIRTAVEEAILRTDIVSALERSPSAYGDRTVFGEFIALAALAAALGYYHSPIPKDPEGVANGELLQKHLARALAHFLEDTHALFFDSMENHGEF